MRSPSFRHRSYDDRCRRPTHARKKVCVTCGANGGRARLRRLASIDAWRENARARSDCNIDGIYRRRIATYMQHVIYATRLHISRAYAASGIFALYADATAARYRACVRACASLCLGRGPNFRLKFFEPPAREARTYLVTLSSSARGARRRTIGHSRSDTLSDALDPVDRGI